MEKDIFWVFAGLLLFLVVGFYNFMVEKWRSDDFLEDFLPKRRLIRIISFSRRGRRVSRLVQEPNSCRIPISERKKQIKRFEILREEKGILIANYYREKYWLFLKKNSS